MSHAVPFESNLDNFIEIVNEFLIFSIGVVSMCLIGRGIKQEDITDQCWVLLIFLYIKLAFNGLVIISLTLAPVFRFIRRKFLRWCPRKKAKKGDTIPQSKLSDKGKKHKKPSDQSEFDPNRNIDITMKKVD